MMYKVVLSEKAVRSLKKMDKSVAKLIMSWLKKNLENCIDPRLQGKPLVGSNRDKWRYRVGDYRILAKIEDEKLVILVVEVGHRKNIYS